jgi:3'-phosphoadenosine 5'-phosphosulfate (PAPS) 3'-phosphatase
MDFAEFERRFNRLEPAVRETGGYIRNARKNGKTEVFIKVDGSPVTNIDMEANERLCRFLEQEFPGEIVIGEESGHKQYAPGSGCVWYVDPIDGTRSFVDGKDGYFILIGLCVEGIPVFGMVYQPEKDILIYGWTGLPATSLNGTGQAQVLMPETPEWRSGMPVVMKAVASIHREYFRDRFNITRAPHFDDMIDMISSLTGASNGFISYRRTAYWDLCAPAALLNASGYKLAATDPELPVTMNDGKLSTAFYYCLPPDTPESFLKELRNRLT